MNLLTAIQTRRFLTVLTPNEPITFQTYSDHDDLKVKHPNGKTTDPNARIMHGTFEQHRKTLEALNERGAGVFAMTNEGDGQGRAASNAPAISSK